MEDSAAAMPAVVPAPKVPWPLGIYTGRLLSTAAHTEDPDSADAAPVSSGKGMMCCGKAFEQDCSLMLSAEHITFNAMQRVYSDPTQCQGPFVERAHTQLARIDSYDSSAGILRLKIWSQHEKKHETKCYYTEWACPAPSFFGLAVQPCTLTLVEIGGKSADWGKDKACEAATYSEQLASREPAWRTKPWCRDAGGGGKTAKGLKGKASPDTSSKDEAATGSDEPVVSEFSRIYTFTLTTPLGKDEMAKEGETPGSGSGSAGWPGNAGDGNDGRSVLSRLLRKSFS